MESFEKKMLLELLKTIKECDNRLKTLEEVLYVEDSEIEDVVTPITIELSNCPWRSKNTHQLKPILPIQNSWG